MSRGASRRAPSGLLLGGGFGAGKSHLLTHLGHLAMSDGFVVSTVVISKETPLHDPVKTIPGGHSGRHAIPLVGTRPWPMPQLPWTRTRPDTPS